MTTGLQTISNSGISVAILLLSGHGQHIRLPTFDDPKPAEPNTISRYVESKPGCDFGFWVECPDTKKLTGNVVVLNVYVDRRCELEHEEVDLNEASSFEGPVTGRSHPLGFPEEDSEENGKREIVLQIHPARKVNSREATAASKPGDETEESSIEPEIEPIKVPGAVFSWKFKYRSMEQLKSLIPDQIAKAEEGIPEVRAELRRVKRGDLDEADFDNWQGAYSSGSAAHPLNPSYKKGWVLGEELEAGDQDEV